MTRLAVFLADGFEEIEAVAPIDILRRANMTVDVIGLSEAPKGAHDITILVDQLLKDNFDVSDYDGVILPGGLPGAQYLWESETVLRAVQEAAQSGKLVAAICAAPIVLDKAGVLEGRKYTSFPGTEAQIEQGERLANEKVVVDDHFITGRGPGTALDFAYAIAEYFGEDVFTLKGTMQYS